MSPQEPTRPEPAPSPVPSTLATHHNPGGPDADASTGTPDDPGRTVTHAPPQPHPRQGGLPEVPGYELLGKIAQGGMGVVYTARDLSLDRQVAVKTLLPHFRGRGDLLAEFEREARITARLPHPGVPPVHALGVLPDGRPFLAMKLIRGRTLHDELDGIDRQASLPRLLGVFEQICQTVGYAHSVGIIHRDLKPLNVMVGAFAEVQVMDWGLAKSGIGDRGSGIGEESDWSAATSPETDHAHLTRQGSTKGTPAYMPPEQARGEWDRVDARADVFALGAVLAVILTGAPAYRGASVQVILAQAAEGDLDEAFGRLDRCGADAELVSLAKRCLQPRPEDRPADGKAVADALAAHRAGVEERLRQVERDRAAAEVRFAEQRKRRRVQLALAAAVVLMVAAGAAFAWWEDRRVTRLRSDEEQRQSRNREAAADFLAQTEAALRAGDADRAAEMLDQGERRVAEGGGHELAGRLGRCRDDLRMLRELDRIDRDRWRIVGTNTTRWASTIADWDRAFDGYGIPVAALPAAEAARLVDGSFLRERLLTVMELWFVGEDHVRLRDVLNVVDPDEFRRASRARNYQRAAIAWGFRGRPQPAHPVWFAVGHAGNRHVSPQAREGLLLKAHLATPNRFTLLMSLGALHQLGDRESAGRSAGWYRAALAVNPRHPIAWQNLGLALDDAGDHPAAVTALRESLRLDPTDATAHYNFAGSLKNAGDLAGAVAEYRKAIELRPDFTYALGNLGLALLDAKDHAGATAALREAVRIDPRSSVAHTQLGYVLGETGDLKGAVAAYREAIRLAPNDADPHFRLGRCLSESGDLPGAVAAFREAARLDPTETVTHENLADALQESGDLPGAIAAFREAIRLEPRKPAPHHGLGVALHAAKDYAGAAASYREGLRWAPNDYQFHHALGLALWELDRDAEALAAFRDTVRLNPNYPRGFYSLGRSLAHAKDNPGAIAAFREAVRLDPKYAVAWGYLGTELFRANDVVGAKSAFAEALRLEPKTVIAHRGLAGLHLNEKRYPEAVAAAREVVRLNPQDDFGYVLLGRALAASGDVAGGKAAFAQAVRLDPKLWTTEFHKRFPLPVAPPPREVEKEPGL